MPMRATDPPKAVAKGLAIRLVVHAVKTRSVVRMPNQKLVRDLVQRPSGSGFSAGFACSSSAVSLASSFSILRSCGMSCALAWALADVEDICSRAYDFAFVDACKRLYCRRRQRTIDIARDVRG